MNSQIKECRGFVLRTLRYGETSRVVTLFTRELGKIGAMAKGAREPRSQFGSSLELFCLSSYVVYHRSGRDLQFLKTGWTERSLAPLWEDAERFLHASALVEFLDRILLEDEPSPEIYDLALRGLEVLAIAPRGRLRELFRAFQLRAAALLGYAPLLEACLHCGLPLPENAEASGEVWLFHPADGGAFCPSCAPGVESGIRIRPRALRRFRTMALGRGESEVGEALDAVTEMGSGDARASGGASVVREAPVVSSTLWLAALERMVEEYLRFHLERYRGLKSLRFRLDSVEPTPLA